MATMAAILKIYFSLLPIDLKHGRKHWDDLQIKNSKKRFDWKSKMASMAAILKIYILHLLLNRKAS